MTLTEALALLHKAGSIRCIGGDPAKSLPLDAPGTARIDVRGFTWRCGQDGLWRHDRGLYHGSDYAPQMEAGSSWEYALTDPATRGALLDIAREAWGDPGIHIAPHSSGAIWWVYTGKGHGPIGSGPTEGEAIAAAIIAAAEALEAP